MGKLEPFAVFNIGTGRGASVEQVAQATMEVTGRMITLEIGPRREGDPAILVADNRKLMEQLGYELQYSDLETIIKTSMH
jgi:UDP-glucose 4-epimerase